MRKPSGRLERPDGARIAVGPCMANLRFIEPGATVEITRRTNGERYFLKPSRALNAAITSIVAQALLKYPVALHAMTVLSNHLHMIVTPCDGEALTRFMQYVHSNIAKAAQRIHGIHGVVWNRCRSGRVIQILDAEAQIKRVRYVLSHGAKERLVTSPRVWPGFQTVNALCGEEYLQGRCIDERALRRLSRGTRTPAPAEYSTEVPLELTPLPALAHLSIEEQHQFYRDMVASIEDEYAGPVLGIEAVLAQDPMDRPLEPKRGRAPVVHTSCAQTYRTWEQLVPALTHQYRAAAAKHAAARTSVTWPYDVFLPAVQFHRVSRDEERPAPALLTLAADASRAAAEWRPPKVPGASDAAPRRMHRLRTALHGATTR